MTGALPWALPWRLPGRLLWKLQWLGLWAYTGSRYLPRHSVETRGRSEVARGVSTVVCALPWIRARNAMEVRGHCRGASPKYQMMSTLPLSAAAPALSPPPSGFNTTARCFDRHHYRSLVSLISYQVSSAIYSRIWWIIRCTLRT